MKFVTKSAAVFLLALLLQTTVPGQDTPALGDSPEPVLEEPAAQGPRLLRTTIELPDIGERPLSPEEDREPWPYLLDEADLLEPGHRALLENILAAVREAEDVELFVHTIPAEELQAKARELASRIGGELDTRTAFVMVFTPQPEQVVTGQSTIMELAYGKEELAILKDVAHGKGLQAGGHSERVLEYTQFVARSLAPDAVGQVLPVEDEPAVSSAIAAVDSTPESTNDAAGPVEIVRQPYVPAYLYGIIAVMGLVILLLLVVILKGSGRRSIWAPSHAAPTPRRAGVAPDEAESFTAKAGSVDSGKIAESRKIPLAPKAKDRKGTADTQNTQPTDQVTNAPPETERVINAVMERLRQEQQTQKPRPMPLDAANPKDAAATEARDGTPEDQTK